MTKNVCIATVEKDYIKLIRFFGGFDTFDEFEVNIGNYVENVGCTMDMLSKWDIYGEPITNDLLNSKVWDDFKWDYTTTLNDAKEIKFMRINIYEKNTGEIVCSKLLLNNKYFKIDNLYNNTENIFVDLPFKTLIDIVANGGATKIAYINQLVNNDSLAHINTFFHTPTCDAFLWNHNHPQWWGTRNIHNPTLNKNIHIETKIFEKHIYFEIYDLDDNNKKTTNVPKYFFNLHTFVD